MKRLIVSLFAILIVTPILLSSLPTGYRVDGCSGSNSQWMKTLAYRSQVVRIQWPYSRTVKCRPSNSPQMRASL